MMMKVYKYNVSDTLILEYCRVINALEKSFSYELEYERALIHREILKSVGMGKAGVCRNERLFMSALNDLIVDLTFKESDNITVLNKPLRIRY